MNSKELKDEVKSKAERVAEKAKSISTEAKEKAQKLYDRSKSGNLYKRDNNIKDEDNE
jgi:hypothetical protein